MKRADHPAVDIKRLSAAVVVSVAALCYLHDSADAQCQYEVTAIIQADPCPWTGPPPTYGLGLNDSGWVVGYQRECESSIDLPFLWTLEEGYQLLPLPAGTYGGRANDINDNGLIACTLDKSGVGKRGFIYDLKTGEWTELPPVNPEHGWSTASAINNAGQVVGYRSIEDGVNPYNAYIWSKKEGFTDLGLLGYDTTSAADASIGTVAGNAGTFGEGEAFLWDSGKLQLLGVPDGTTASAAGGLYRRWVVGGAVIGDPPDATGQPALWMDGEWRLLGWLPGCQSGNARDVNSRGQVVGFCTEPGGLRRGFMWHADQMNDLNDLVDAPAGIQIERVFTINNAGQIIADGKDAQGDIVGFLLSPIDPSAGDIDGDCDTDLTDLVILLERWSSTYMPADLNDDDIVNVLDLLFLLAHWG